jgi:PAS domain S-box-containing protein
MQAKGKEASRELRPLRARILHRPGLAMVPNAANLVPMFPVTPRRSRTMSRLACVVGIPSFLLTAALLAAEVPEVLVLHSNHPGYPWTAAQAAGIEEGLGATNGTARWHVEHLDARRTDVRRVEAALLDLLEIRHRDRRFRALIATDRRAVEFVLRHPDRIAPGAPRTFSGISRAEHVQLGRLPGWSGVFEDYDLAGNLDLIHRLLPDVKQVLVVYNEPDPNAGSQIGVDDFLTRLTTHDAGMSVVAVRKFRFPELVDRLSKLERGTAVYIDGVAADEDGLDFSPARVRELGRAVKVPVFTGHDEVFADLGIGGRITSGRESGRLAATLALKRIAAPDAAPELVGTPMVHRARPAGLRRWNIPESRLPVDTLLEVPASERPGEPGFQWMAGSALIAGLAVAVALLARSNHVRRETVRRLSESESIYRTLVEQMPDAVFLIDMEEPRRGVILSVNAAGAELHGYRAEELVGMRVQQLDTPEAAALSAARLTRLASGERLTFQVEHFHRDGSRIPMEVTARGIRINGGFRVLAINRDVRARLRQEHRFRELAGKVAARSGEDFLTAVVEFLAREFSVEHVAILLRDPGSVDALTPSRRLLRGRIIPSASRPVAGNPEEVVLDGRGVLIPSGLRERHPTDTLARTEGFDSFVGVPLRDPESRVIGLISCSSAAPLEGPNGEDLLSVIQVLAHSVSTEILQMESRRRLELSERQYRQLIESAPVGVVIIQGGNVVYSNPAAGSMTAVPESLSFLGAPALDFVYPADRPALELRLRRLAVNEVGMPATEVRLQRLDGRVFPVEMRAVGTTFEGRSAMAVLFSDLSERLKAEEDRRRLEAQLRQAGRLEALGTLAGGIAHDFNNLLTAILGNLEIAERSLPEGSPARAHLAAVRAPTSRAGDLVARMMTFVRREEGRRVPIDLPEAIGELLDLLRPTLPQGVVVRTDYDASLPPVLADVTQIHQIILNLCTNALHAMEAEGGQLRVGLKARTLDSEAAAGWKVSPGTYVQLSIEDTGVGMERSVLERIFEPFFTTKPAGKGTGLGLAMVQGTVREHQGGIEVASEPGVGTTFRILLPASRDSESVKSAPDHPVSGRGERVLVVDDEPSVALVAVRFLECLGYRAISCTDPLKVGGLIRESEPPFDAVVSDLTMPGMNGIALLAEIRKTHPVLPVLLSSGYSGNLTDLGAREAGFAGLLHKPYSLSAMGHAMASILDRGTPEGVHASA